MARRAGLTQVIQTSKQCVFDGHEENLREIPGKLQSGDVISPGNPITPLAIPTIDMPGRMSQSELLS
jgi:hypothetical protein